MLFRVDSRLDDWYFTKYCKEFRTSQQIFLAEKFLQNTEPSTRQFWPFGLFDDPRSTDTKETSKSGETSIQSFPLNRII